MATSNNTCKTLFNIKDEREGFFFFKKKKKKKECETGDPRSLHNLAIIDLGCLHCLSQFQLKPDGILQCLSVSQHVISETAKLEPSELDSVNGLPGLIFPGLNLDSIHRVN